LGVVEATLDHSQSFTVVGPVLGRAGACEPVLRSLPEWFGIEEAVVHYVAEIDGLPTFLTLDPRERVTGFLSVKEHYRHAAELYVMGLRREWHGRGLGRALVSAAQAYLLDRGVEYLQVKTLGPSHPDENYRRTRGFYEAMGFRPLEELLDLWDERNPCLLMVKRL
jgi:GNAT superfamily N-acetyltransferase